MLVDQLMQFEENKTDDLKGLRMLKLFSVLSADLIKASLYKPSFCFILRLRYDTTVS